MTEISDMTHEELVTEARRVARLANKPALRALANRLQAAVDAEKPSMDLAREVIAALSR